MYKCPCGRIKYPLCIYPRVLLISRLILICKGKDNIDFHSGCTGLHSKQQWINFPYAPPTSSPARTVTWAIRQSETYKMEFQYCCFQCLCNWFLVQKVISCANVFKAIPQLPYYQVQCVCFYVEVFFNLLWLMLMQDNEHRYTCIFLHNNYPI